MTPTRQWWQTGVIYQIYPRSFQDSNGDGIGDLNGILSRIDYLESLNIQGVWISPIYPSPMLDFGYDVSDYVGIHPLFGSLDDFDRLLAALHGRGIKVILDLVPNHTSYKHEWFLESRSSKTNPKRDWYIWRDPAPNGGPPNNWISIFGGPAWTFDEDSGQYYLHQFHWSQPELNYRNPEVLGAMKEVIRFWLRRGVDGFRVDVIWMMMKDAGLRDNPVNANGNLEPIYSQNVAGIHDLIAEFRAVIDEFPDRVMIGEIYEPVEKLVTYYGKGDECHLPFNFNLILAPWEAQLVGKHVQEFEAALPEGAWPNYVLGNHDQHRMASRLGPEQARVAAMFLLTVRGTPTWYYGDEIGMHNVSIPPEMIQDPPALNMPEKADIVGRDPERTPMQWDSSVNAGFCPEEALPWLPVASDARTINVDSANADGTSMLSLFRALTELRAAEPALHSGSIQVIESGQDKILAYLRSQPGSDRFLVVLNFGGRDYSLNLSSALDEQAKPQAEVVVNTGMGFTGAVNLGAVNIAAHEGLLIRLGD